MTENVSHVYKIEFNVINVETSEVIDYSDTLMSIREKDALMANVFRHYAIILRIDNEQRKYLTENKINFSFKILRSTNILSADGSEVETVERTYDKDVEEDVIRPFNKPIIEMIKSEDYNNEEDKSLETQKASYKVECISINSIKINSAVVNAVYLNTNITNPIINMISEQFTGKLHMQKPDNIQLYRSVLVPPMNLVPAIRFIDQNYGLYKAGISMFITKKDFFLYSMTDFNRSFENKLSINVVNATQNTDSSLYSYVSLDDDENLTISYKNAPILGDVSDIVNDKLGAEMMVNSLDDNLNVVTRNYEHSNDYDKIRYYWNEQGISVFENRTVLTKSTTITMPNIDPSLVSPSTEITINGSTIPNVNGRYILLQKIVSYETSDHQTFNSTMILSIAR